MLSATLQLRGQSIYTIAGGGTDDGRPALYVALETPSRIAIDASGNVYVSEGQRVRKLAIVSGIMSTAAGIGSPGIIGDGGPATAAALFNPVGIAFDRAGNLYIADSSNDRVRKVSQDGVIIKLAGKLGPVHGFDGDGGPATEAELAGPQGVAVDDAGNLFIADTDNNRIRKVNAAGIIDTIAGNGVAGFAGDGGPATLASFNHPTDVAVDRAGNLYVVDTDNHRIRRISAGGVISTLAGNGDPGRDGVGTFSGDGGPAVTAGLALPNAIALDASGNLYISDYFNHRIRRIDGATGIIDSVAGSGTAGFAGDNGPATAGQLFWPSGIAVDTAGTLYIGDTQNNRVRRVASGIMTTVAGNGSTRYTGDGGPATAAALDIPQKVAVDRSGNVYIADASNGRIRKRSADTGFITTVAGTEADVGEFGDGGPATAAGIEVYDVAVDASGNLYIAGLRANGIRKVTVSTGVISTLPVRGTSVSVDGKGDVYTADRNDQTIRKLDVVTGLVTTIAGTGTAGFSGDGGAAAAAQISDPEGVTVDAFGDIYIADGGNNRVRRISAVSNIISTVAGDGTNTFSGDGNQATAVGLSYPSGVALDRAGNLYIAETSNDRIRRVSADGVITTVAGTGASALTGDGAPARAASLNNPGGVSFDNDGNLYIADTFNDRIRVIPACVAISTPVLSQPSNGSTGERAVPKLSWSAVKGAFYYDVYLDTVNPPLAIVAADVTAPTYSPALEPFTQYYWRVVAKGDPFCSSPASSSSTVFSFTTVGSCSPPGVFETRGVQ